MNRLYFSLLLGTILLVPSAILCQNPFPSSSGFTYEKNGDFFQIGGTMEGEYIDTLDLDFLDLRMDMAGNCDGYIGCYANALDGLMGEKAWATSEVNWSFETTLGDTLHFQFDVMADALPFFETSDAQYVLHQGSSEEATFLGIADLVTSYDVEMIPTNGTPVQITDVIRIGNETGVQRFLDLDEFPQNVQSFDLIGGNEFEEGFNGLTYADCYDYQPGDMIQSLIQVQTQGITQPTYRMDSIISRTDFSNEVSYLIKVTTHTYYEEYQGQTDWWSTNINTETYNYSKSLIKEIPARQFEGEWGIGQYGLYTQTTLSGQTKWKLNLTGNGGVYCEETGLICPNEVIGSSQTTYVEDVGRTHYSDDPLWGEYQANIIYYNIDGVTWGNQFVGTTDIDRTSFNIFPNPASEGVLYVDGCLQDDLLTVLTLQGQIVHQEVARTPGRRSLSTENLAAGMYLIQITNERYGIHETVKVQVNK